MAAVSDDTRDFFGGHKSGAENNVRHLPVIALAVGADFIVGLFAVHDGHQGIHDDHAVMALKKLFQRLASIRRAFDMNIAEGQLEELYENIPDEFFIFRHEDGAGGGGFLIIQRELEVIADGAVFADNFPQIFSHVEFFHDVDQAGDFPLVFVQLVLLRHAEQGLEGGC